MTKSEIIAWATAQMIDLTERLELIQAADPTAYEAIAAIVGEAKGYKKLVTMINGGETDGKTATYQLS